MARLGDSFEAAGLAGTAADWYDRSRRQVPEAFRDCNPAVLRHAYRLAGGVWERMEVTDDGALIVHAEPVWS